MSNVLIILVIGSIGLLLFFIPRRILKKRNDKIKALGAERYNELKNNFDARRIMEEMNYIIDQINEYCEQNEVFRESYRKTGGSPTISQKYISIVSKPIFQSLLGADEMNRIEEERRY